MKKRLLTLQFFAVLILLIIIAVAPASSWGLATGDGTWQWVNPSVQGNTLRSLSFVNANTGWAAGDGGTILKTTDGGASWSAQIPSSNSCTGVTPYGSGCNLKGVSFFDANNGWAVGAFGTIWKTINGGTSWTAQSLPIIGCGGSCVYANLSGVHFISSTVGIAVGPSYAFATRDGGASWTQVTGINTSHSLNAIQLVDSNNGFAVGDNGAVYKITWNGSTWAAAQQTGTGTQSLTGLYFANAANGFAVGGGRLWRTVNGGTTWLKNETLRTENFRAVTMTGTTLVVTGGTEVFGEHTGSSVILKRTATTNWTDSVDTVAAGLSAATTGTTDQLLAVVFPGGSSTGFAAGEAGGVVKTTDTGSNWSLNAGGNSKRFSDSSFINDMTGWMVAMDGSVIKTTNAGGTWTSDASGIAAGTKLRGVSFLDASTGFAVGYSGLLGNATNAGVAYKYVSGTWSAMTVPAGVVTLEAVHMTGATSGWAVGRAPGDTGVGAGVALKTTDGSNWVFDSSGIDGNIRLYGVDATSASNGWAVGENATSGAAVLLKYTAGSPGTWTVTEKADSTGFISIDMVDGTTGYAVGYKSPSAMYPPYWQDSRVYKTVDGGATWNSSLSTTLHQWLFDVSFFNSSTGYIAGSEGRILKTTDGGSTWTVESAGAGSNLNTVSVVPSTWSALGYAVFAAGNNASILRSPSIDETKIIEKWSALGGAPGAAIGAATPITGGSIYQDYVNGRLYWNQSVDQVFWIHGAILPKYDSLGREAGVLGLPTSDELAIPGGVNQNYSGGRMYWSAATGPREVHGAILTKFDGLGGTAGYGFPISDVLDISATTGVPGAQESDFQGVRIYTSAADTFEVHGAILGKYIASGGLTNGMPTSNETVVPDNTAGRYNTFAGGARIYWSPWTGAHIINGAILAKYLNKGGAGAFGFPATDIYNIPGVPGATECDLQYARIYNSAATGGAHEVHGAILSKYLAYGGPAAWGGLPTTDEAVPGAITSERYNDFEHAQIYWSPSTGTAIVYGLILAEYKTIVLNMGYDYYGLPIADEGPVPGFAAGRKTELQKQNAAIYWSSTTGAHEVRGAIRGKWLAVGGPARFGLPIQKEEVAPGGIGQYSIFSGGFSGPARVYWSSATGAHEVHGAILDKYISLGESGSSQTGLPLTDEYNYGGSTKVNDFQHGVIWWTSYWGAQVQPK
ncbi:MAG: YCF48-related protein [Thermoleophilia bacterium]